MQCYSADELEHWAMRRLTVDEQWRSDQRLEPACKREFTFSVRGMKHTCLIEGGRWLMALFKGGIVRAVDLDHPNMPEQIVISPHDEFDAWPVAAILSDNVQTGGNLKFNVAMLYDYKGLDHAPQFLCVVLNLGSRDRR